MEPRPPLEGFSAWYDDQQGDTGDLWHRTLIDPGLFAALGEVRPGERILDVGCGNGYIARRLARAGARVTGIDASPELIARAREREGRDPLGVVYLEGDAARLDGLADASFDTALANMSLMDIEDAAGAIRSVARVVVEGGSFVFSISHPCFDVDTRSSYVVEPVPDTTAPSEVFRKVTRYRTLHEDRYPWELGEGRTALTRGYHRPLSWYARTLREAGWVILDLIEPTPTSEFVGRRIRKEWIEQIPLHLVVSARRVRASKGPLPSRRSRQPPTRRA